MLLLLLFVFCVAGVMSVFGSKNSPLHQVGSEAADWRVSGNFAMLGGGEGGEGKPYHSGGCLSTPLDPPFDPQQSHNKTHAPAIAHK